MENIENVFRSTKIPVPLAPLPALPRHLLSKRKQNEIKERHPLQTLHRQTVNSAQAGPSNNVNLVPNKLKHASNVNPEQVSLRKNCDNLDWDYEVFNDNHKEADICVVQNNVDEEEFSKLQNEKNDFTLAENGNKNCLDEQKPAVTPVVKSAQLEHSRIKNIKRSLRRPHSRELLGLSPAAKQAKKLEDSVKRRLHFNDDLGGTLRKTDTLVVSYTKSLNRDYSKEMFHYLLTIEKKPIDTSEVPWITRACVINWLIKLNRAEGNPAVVQCACWYLDSLLGISSIEMDKLQLVAAACYWIAQKFQGPVYRGLRLVALADNAFTLEDLLRAERAILQRMEFPNNPVVPQEFISYLSWWCNSDNPAEIEDASTFICMSGIMVDKALCKEFPSAIAAASVRNALLLMGKKDKLSDLQMCPVFIAAEKKSSKMSYMCAILRQAVRTISAPNFEFKTLCEQYGKYPKYITQTIVGAANAFSVLDTRSVNM